MEKAVEIMKYIFIFSLSVFLITGIFVVRKAVNYDEANDPNRDYYITRTDNTLIDGEIYEMEFIPAYTDMRKKTEMKSGMGWGINPSTGQYSYYHGFFPVTVSYAVDIPDTYLVRILNDDTERLIHFVNEIEVSESVYENYAVGDIFGNEKRNGVNYDR